MELIKLLRRGLLAGALLSVTLLLAACGGIDPNHPLGNMPPDTELDTGGAALRIGDELVVVFINLPPPYNTPIDDTIKEDGSISLILGETFQAAGKTVNQLRQDVIKRYVPKDYSSVDFTINTPKRTFSVGGEVKSGGSFQYPTEGIGAVDAINLAGGFTPYANHTIEITRRIGGKPIKMNFDKAQQDSTKNIQIYPGDTIYVRQRIF